MISYQQIIESRILTVAELKKKIASWKVTGKKIVFTNGCFDLLHYGHASYLCKARDLGDVLIVGLNSDASMKLQNKGPGRPIQDQKSRSMVIASLHVVDAVVLFDEATPENLIKELLPDVLVKGADYSDMTKIAGYDAVIKNGGEVRTIEFAEGYSTSRIEARIKGG